MISFEWNGIKFNICTVGGGILRETIAPHSHSKNSYELHFITGGSGTLIAHNNQYHLKKGDFFVTGPNLYHAQETDLSDPVEDVFIYIQKISGKKDNYFAEAFLNTDFYIAEDFNCTDAVNILKEYRQKAPDYKTVISGLAMKLLSEITRYYLPEYADGKTDSDNLYDNRFLIIEKSFLYDEDITLTKLSENIGLCPRQTQRLLKKYYGKSFREKKREQISNKL